MKKLILTTVLLMATTAVKSEELVYDYLTNNDVNVGMTLIPKNTIYGEGQIYKILEREKEHYNIPSIGTVVFGEGENCTMQINAFDMNVILRSYGSSYGWNEILQEKYCDRDITTDPDEYLKEVHDKEKAYLESEAKIKENTLTDPRWNKFCKDEDPDKVSVWRRDLCTSISVSFMWNLDN